MRVCVCVCVCVCGRRKGKENVCESERLLCMFMSSLCVYSVRTLHMCVCALCVCVLCVRVCVCVALTVAVNAASKGLLRILAELVAGA